MTLLLYIYYLIAHKLQPLDVSLDPPNRIYVQITEIFLRNNSGRMEAQLQLTRIFAKALLKATVLLNAVYRFRKLNLSEETSLE